MNPSGKIKWEQVDDRIWHGRQDGCPMVREIEYLPTVNMFVVDGTRVAYRTLRGAKIAAGRTQFVWARDT